MLNVIESASACVAVTLMACGSMSFAIVFADAVSCDDTRNTVIPAPVMAADARMVYSCAASVAPMPGDTPAMVKTTDGVAVTADTLMKNSPSDESVYSVADDVAVLAALGKITSVFFIFHPTKENGAEAPYV